MNFLKTAILLVFLSSIASCKSDADSIKENSILGEWQRSDSDDTFEYKITFNADNTGSEVERNGSSTAADGGQGTSSVSSFNWSIEDDILTIDTYQVFITTVSFNEEGQLFLSDFTPFHFDKL